MTVLTLYTGNIGSAFVSSCLDQPPVCGRVRTRGVGARGGAITWGREARGCGFRGCKWHFFHAEHCVGVAAEGE